MTLEPRPSPPHAAVSEAELLLHNHFGSGAFTFFYISEVGVLFLVDPYALLRQQ
jgi:hypothetical protein